LGTAVTCRIKQSCHARFAAVAVAIGSSGTEFKSGIRLS
jgi:hypothetical protein